MHVSRKYPLQEVENGEVRRLARSVVRQRIKEVRARLRVEEATRTYREERNKTGMNSEKLRKAVEEKICQLPAQDWVIDADRGAIREAPFDEDRVLLGLAFDLLRMEGSLLGLISEMEGALFPESMQARLERLEKRRPDSRDLLVDLARGFRDLPEWLRRALPNLLKDKKVTDTLSSDETVHSAIRSLARLRLEASR